MFQENNATDTEYDICGEIKQERDYLGTVEDNIFVPNGPKTSKPVGIRKGRC